MKKNEMTMFILLGQAKGDCREAELIKTAFPTSCLYYDNQASCQSCAHLVTTILDCGMGSNSQPLY